MHFIIKLLLSALAVLVASKILPGISVDDLTTSLIVAAVLAFLNAVVKPIMIILTIPITLVTLGLFLIVINGLLVLLADYLVDGFQVDGFIPALLFSLIISLINAVFDSLVRDSRKSNN